MYFRDDGSDILLSNKIVFNPMYAHCNLLQHLRIKFLMVLLEKNLLVFPSPSIPWYFYSKIPKAEDKLALYSFVYLAESTAVLKISIRV